MYPGEVEEFAVILNSNAGSVVGVAFIMGAAGEIIGISGIPVIVELDEFTRLAFTIPNGKDWFITVVFSSAKAGPVTEKAIDIRKKTENIPRIRFILCISISKKINECIFSFSREN
jgi:hypothetical protein